METLVTGNSPLGSYLEGKGEAEQLGTSLPSHELGDDRKPSNYAPINVVQRKARHLINPVLKSDAASPIRRLYAALVNATLGSNGNTGFLEHFRYQIIASQLLDENVGSVTSPTQPCGHPPLRSPLPELTATTTGACAATAISFTFVWIIQWARSEGNTKLWGWRALVATTFSLLLVVGIWVYTTRRSILYLRRNALDATSTFTTNLQSLNSSSTSVLSLIQEVELVSRGYRISHPLPPVSRIEGTDQPRKAQRLRRVLQEGYQRLNPVLMRIIENIRPLVDQNDVERFLDVYEVRSGEIEDALQSSEDLNQEDTESLQNLGIQQARYGTLRRLLLCSLLSLQATGRRADVLKWQLVTTSMEDISALAGELAQTFIKLLSDEDHLPPTPVTNRRRTISGKDQSIHQLRVESQVKRISTLSSGIRSLHAKVYLLREESSRALASSISEQERSGISRSLLEQYEGLGADFQSLMQAFEAGKQALARDISEQERRMSQPSSPAPSRMSHRPVSSSNRTLSSVTQNAHTFPSLHGAGDMPLSPPVTDDGSDDHSADDEVFEAISSPKLRQRSKLSREERIAQAKEEREQLQMAQEKREAGNNMVKELQSVIKLRPMTRARKPNAHESVSSA